MSTAWNRTTKYLVGVGLVLFGLYVLYLSGPVLPMLVIAALVSFLVLPLVNFFNGRLKVPRGLAVLLTYLLVAIVLLLSPLIFLPPVINGFNFLLNIDYDSLVVRVQEWMVQTLLHLQSVDFHMLGFSLDLKPIVAPALALVQDTSSSISLSLPSIETIVRSLRSAVNLTYGFATNIAGAVFTSILTFFVTLLSSIYMTVDAPKFTQRLLNIVPAPYRSEIAILLKRLNQTWRAYLRGQLYLMVIIGVLTWLGATAIGLPGAFALAVIAGVLELIPNLGPFLAAVPAVVVALIQGSTYLPVNNLVFALIVIGLYVLIQQIENTFLVPRILGEAVDLHPLVVLIGVIVGTNVAGILGALLAAPVIASVREIVSYLYAKILGEDPFPPETEEPKPETRSWSERFRLLTERWRQLLQPGSNPSTPTAVEEIQADIPPES